MSIVCSPLATFTLTLRAHWDCLVTGAFMKLCHALGGLYMGPTSPRYISDNPPRRSTFHR